MAYSAAEVLEYVRVEDVKFIRLAFCDVYGNLKNTSVMPNELERAFESGITFDGSAIVGFEGDERSDLLLFPDPSTLTVLPWRPSHGKVVRLFCDVRYPDGREYEADCRSLLKRAIKYAEKMGITFNFGAEFEFYLFKTDENGEKTMTPYDRAGYFDVAPADKGENVRREICLTLEEMGIVPESSHHEKGPGQNEIDFRHSEPLSSADHAITFKNVVETVAGRNGLWASFDPKPLDGESGNGMHVNVSVHSLSDKNARERAIAGLLRRARETALFFNPVEKSYWRLGKNKAPEFISWAKGSRTRLIRVPERGEERLELRSPDPCANPYLAYALIIYAVAEAFSDGVELEKDNSPSAPERLPASLSEAKKAALESDFLVKFIPEKILSAYLK